MDFTIPEDLENYYEELVGFIETEIIPLEQQDDNIRFFDHRREYARTDFEKGGLPREDWEELLREARKRADAAGHWRFSAPKKYGGKDGSNLWMAVIRDRFAQRGLGLHNDLQNEHSIVGNFPFVEMFEQWGTEEQKEEFILGGFEGKRRVAFGLTEPHHGSDATHMETKAVRETRDGVDGWRIDGEKMWITGMHVATHCAMFARTSGEVGDAAGSPASSCATRPRGWRSRSGCGPSTCPPTTRASASTTSGCQTVPFLVSRAGAFRWRRVSSTRTASARPRAAAAQRSIASRKA